MTISRSKIIQCTNPALFGEMLYVPDIVLPDTVALPNDAKLYMGTPFCEKLSGGIKIGDIFNRVDLGKDFAAFPERRVIAADFRCYPVPDCHSDRTRNTWPFRW